MTAPRQESPCLSDRDLAEFNTGQLDDETVVQRIAEHLGGCESCDSRLSALPQDWIVALLQAPDPLQSIANAEALDLSFSVAATKSRAKSESNIGRAYRDVRTPAAGNLPVRIDRYFVVRKLGQGGFAEVFLAKDPERNQLVAIKTPRTDKLSTREQRDSFLREARTVATLDHPHIVPMFDCRELPDGRCIVVMKYIEGETLHSAMKKGRFKSWETAELVACVADALHHAHAKGIWHRDVTPANILLDREGRPHLTDFGLALHKHQQAADPFPYAGTARYMPPEQKQGDSKRLDGRADVWSLGVVLYELLTRERPFREASPGKSDAEGQESSHRPLLSVAPTTPPELARICDRCLRHDVSQRYETAADLAADLRAFVRRPSRWQVALATGFAAALVLGVIGVVIALTASPPNPSPIVPIGIAAAAPEGASGKSVAAPTWRPIFKHKPTEAAWHHVGNNTYDPDTQRERLLTRHDFDRGFLTFGELTTSDFQVRYVMSIENWKGSGGFYWGMHADREAFPERLHRCLVLVARRVLSDPTKLELSMEDMEFIPSPFDNTKLVCRHSNQFAWARVELPARPALALHLIIEQGKIVELRLNDRVVPLRWEGNNVPWSAMSPADYGFMTFNGVVVFENASLDSEVPENGEAE